MKEKKKYTPVVERPHPRDPDGKQKLYRFKNNYGASVIQSLDFGFGGSYGAAQSQWELAVIKFSGSELSPFSLCYDTGITDDVIGNLDEDEVEEILAKIEALC